MTTKYRPRVVDNSLKRKLEGIGAVLLEGPKLCGKTATAERFAHSVLYMANPEDWEENIQMVSIKPSLLLKGATPRLIDEWQLAPKLWDAVRFEIDHRGQVGQCTLTGSVLPQTVQRYFILARVELLG